MIVQLLDVSSILHVVSLPVPSRLNVLSQVFMSQSVCLWASIVTGTAAKSYKIQSQPLHMCN